VEKKKGAFGTSPCIIMTLRRFNQRSIGICIERARTRIEMDTYLHGQHTSESVSVKATTCA